MQSVKITDFASESAVEAAVKTGLKGSGDLSDKLQNQLVDLSGNGSALTSSTIAPCTSAAADDATSVSIGTCTFGDKTATSTVVLTGDSRAEMWSDTYNQIANAAKIKLVVLVKAGCPGALANFSVVSGKGVPSSQIWKACGQWHDFVIKTVNTLKPKVVVNSSASTLYLNGETSYASESDTKSAFTKFYKALPASSVKVVLGKFPAVGGDGNPVLCLSKKLDAGKCSTSVPDRIASRDDAQQDAAKQAKTTYVDESRWACDGDKCPAVVNDLIPYTVDGFHVNQQYAKYLTGVMWAAVKPYLGT